MNKLFCVLAYFSFSFSFYTLADDTEIYGASAIDAANRVNSNLMFIMDTSGSMGVSVDITLNAYNTNTAYPGSYYFGDVYNSLNAPPSKGHQISALTKSSSTDCSDDVTTINTIGKVLGVFQQYRSDRWRSLIDGSDNTIRCNSGSSRWLYSGNYMNWYHDSSNRTSSTRMEVVLNVVKELTHSLKDINLGLMRFDQNSDGGMVDVAVSDINISGPLIRNKLAAYYPQGAPTGRDYV